MNKSISDNSRFTIPEVEVFHEAYEAATLADHQAVLNDQHYQAARDAEAPPPRQVDGEIDNDTFQDFCWRYDRMQARAAARFATRARTGAYRNRTCARARHSPASTRRATADSGGSDGDGDGGDPEPPHRPSYSLPTRCDGGAL